MQWTVIAVHAPPPPGPPLLPPRTPSGSVRRTAPNWLVRGVSNCTGGLSVRFRQLIRHAGGEGERGEKREEREEENEAGLRGIHWPEWGFCLGAPISFEIGPKRGLSFFFFLAKPDEVDTCFFRNRGAEAEPPFGRANAAEAGLGAPIRQSECPEAGRPASADPLLAFAGGLRGRPPPALSPSLSLPLSPLLFLFSSVFLVPSQASVRVRYEMARVRTEPRRRATGTGLVPGCANFAQWIAIAVHNPHTPPPPPPQNKQCTVFGLVRPNRPGLFGPTRPNSLSGCGPNSFGLVGLNGPSFGLAMAVAACGRREEREEGGGDGRGEEGGGVFGEERRDGGCRENEWVWEGG